MSLKDDRQQNIQIELDFSSALTGAARGVAGEETESSVATNGPESPAKADRLMEEVCERENLKEAWNKRASRWTKTGYKAPAPDERATYREVHFHQGAKRRFGDGARKATELTPGDLLRVASATAASARRPDHGAEVSRGHSIWQQRRPERDGVVSRP